MGRNTAGTVVLRTYSGRTWIRCRLRPQYYVPPNNCWSHGGEILQKHRPFTTRPCLRTENLNAKSNILSHYGASFDSPIREESWAQLTEANIGREVVLHGYLGSRSDLSKNMSFAPLIDKTLNKTIQIISTRKSQDGNEKPSHAHLKAISSQSPITIRGILKKRAPTKDKALGNLEKILDVELDLQEVWCLNNFPDDIIVSDEAIFPPGKRHLQLRTDSRIRNALIFRAKVAATCRKVLDDLDFVEVETPMLFKSTPEGAREFLVPTRAKGLAYALPQSPQQYKQILMASGIPKYYQIARCFRDEDLRADRQPEFTQLDLEMSFSNGEDVIKCVEELLQTLWRTHLPHYSLSADPFPRMKYGDAMSRYGSDKPDTRLGMEITTIGHLLPADLISKITPLTDPIVDCFKLRLSQGTQLTKAFVAKFMESPDAKPFVENVEGQPGFFVYDYSKPLQGLQAFGFEAAEHLEELLQLEDGDLVVVQARSNSPFSGGSTSLGDLRLALSRAAVAKDLVPAPEGFSFLWVTDFPLFSPVNDVDPGQGGAAGIRSTHHPFTAPKAAEDVNKLLNEPAEVIGEHYDIVVNGVELGGGSKRIHVAAVQELIFKEVLKMDDERIETFRHLLDVLRSGCPPHAGIALGFDRLIAVMLGYESVRDVIAFPKSGSGEDPLVKSPNPLTEEQLKIYHLQLRDD